MSGKLSILGYYGYANTGDEAILDCLTAGLRKNLPSWEITVFSGDPVHTSEQYGVGAVANILPARVSRLLVGAIGRNRSEFFRAIRTFISSDVLLVGGGGLFFDHPDSNRFLRELLFKMRVAVALGKRVLVTGVSLGPLHHADSRRRLKAVLNSVDLITVRDNESRRMLDELAVNRPEIHTTGDFVFLLSAAPDSRIDEIMRIEKLPADEAPTIAVSVCGYHANIPQWEASLLTFCRHAVNHLGAHVWFVPMQTGGGFDDREGAREIANETGRPDRIRLVEGSYTPRENMGLLARADAVVAERLHGVILALNAHRPLFGISYKPKVSRLFSEIGHDDWQIALEQMTPEALITGFDAVWSNRKSIDAELDAISSTMKDRAKTNLDLIAAMIGDSPA